MASYDEHGLAKALAPGMEMLLAKAVADATEDAIAKAVNDFEDTLRRKIADVAIGVSSFYELERMQNGLKITVKIPA